MKVIFLNRVYPPADGATGQLLAELAPRLVEEGWEVTVVTSRTGEAPRSEEVAGVRVERVGGLSFSRASHWRRALSYLTLYPALLWRALRLPRADVVVTLTDPPLHLLLGVLLKWTKRSQLVHWAQDLYPEVAEELGVLRRNGLLARACRALSTWGLNGHDRIVAVGRCMKARLLQRGLSGNALRVMPNWAHAAQVFPGGHAANPFRREHGLENRFVVMYSGNLGLAHPFEAILDAAQRLQTARPEVLFLVVGGGPRLPWVKKQVEKLQIGNVRFLPPQPLDRLAHSLGAADVHLASMRENLCGLVVPSKVYGILAAGRPCVFLGPRESEVARTLERHECGTVLSGEQSFRPGGARLADCLSAWATDRERGRAAGRRAEKAAAQSGLNEAVAAFDKILREAAAQAEASRAEVSSPSLPCPAALPFQQNPSSTAK